MAELTLVGSWSFNPEPAATAKRHPRRWLGVKRFAIIFSRVEAFLGILGGFPGGVFFENPFIGPNDDIPHLPPFASLSACPSKVVASCTSLGAVSFDVGGGDCQTAFSIASDDASGG